jgi:hypothetical protein
MADRDTIEDAMELQTEAQSISRLIADINKGQPVRYVGTLYMPSIFVVETLYTPKMTEDLVAALRTRLNEINAELEALGYPAVPGRSNK